MSPSKSGNHWHLKIVIESEDFCCDFEVARVASSRHDLTRLIAILQGRLCLPDDFSILFLDRHREQLPETVYPGRVQGSEYLIERVPDKGDRGATFDTRGASSAFTGVGRYVFTAGVF